ncbi:Serine/threonine-protein kinase ULK4 [Sciurus carolinensis]|uniref:Serine/threonine-protein kinase ULK4 n=1 Tax=Sciurus carolinensis TaxID=30640 RepID=A0AA41MVK4_SCICA|nr:Serine/threonine-protein kinase ULK4 [Sciurus carolinensis]
MNIKVNSNTPSGRMSYEEKMRFEGIVDYILPPLISLVQSQNVEWRLFSLRLLSETTSLLVNQEDGDGEEEVNIDSEGNLLALVRDVLLPQYEHILMEPDPVPAYALKLLVAMTEHNPTFTRYSKFKFLCLVSPL